MENLTIFYQVLYEDLSPLYDIPSNYAEHIAFLKKRYPEWEKHFKIRLRKEKKNRYQVYDYEQFCFNELENIIYQDKTAGDKELTPIIQSVSRRLKFKPENVTQSIYQHLGDVIHCELNVNANYDDLPANEARFYYYKVMLFEETRNFQKRLQEKVLELANEEKIRLYIKNYQILIDSYMKKILQDHIPDYQRNAIFNLSKEFTIVDIFKIIYQSLEDILVYMEQSFGPYFDLNQNVSYRSKLLFASEYSSKLEVVLGGLNKLDIDPGLREVITVPFEELENLNAGYFSYRDMHYQREYLLAFYHILQVGHNSADVNSKIILSVLRNMNFNALKFFKYLTNKIEEELSLCENLKEKLEVLYFQNKLYNQSIAKKNLGYNATLPSLKQQMTRWLQEEISFYERKLYSKPKEENMVYNHEVTDKLKLRMSVPQMTLVMKAFYETGLLMGSRREAIRFMNRYYSTENVENISYESLQGKYYKVEDSTRKAVLQMMERVICFLEKP